MISILVPPQRASNRQAGYSLAEVMVAIVILGILLVGVSSMYWASYRLWRRGEPANSAERAAALAIQRMMPDLRSAIAATQLDPPNDATGIRMQLPARTWDATQNTYWNTLATDGQGKPYLVAGNYVLYYRGTASGAASPTGSILWRVLYGPTGYLLRQSQIVQNITDNPPEPDQTQPKPIFKYWPDVTRLRSVEITVSVRQGTGGDTATVTMLSELTLRNH